MRPACAGFTALTTVWIGVLLGCGGGAAAPPVDSTPVPANLAGNWLLAGSLPAAPLGTTTTPLSGVAATFDVNGSNVTGTVHFSETCTGLLGSSTTGGIVSGTVAADGSFTLQSPAVLASPPLDPPVVTITGRVPAMANGKWTGTYSITNPSTTCTVPTSGSIAAISIPLLAGSFSGIAALGPASSLDGAKPVPVTVTLQQGGTETVRGSAIYTNEALSGTITVQGGSCFTSGATAPTLGGSAVEAGDVLATFSMNDGRRCTWSATSPYQTLPSWWSSSSPYRAVAAETPSAGPRR